MVVTERCHERQVLGSSFVAQAHHASPALRFDTERLIAAAVSQSVIAFSFVLFPRLLRDLLSGKNVVFYPYIILSVVSPGFNA